MDAFKVHAESIRRTARQLLAIADRMDPPVVPAKASPVARLICPDCGTEYAGPEYRSGDACLTVLPGGQHLCQGFLAYKSDLARPDIATCDVCGLRISDGRANDGAMCGKMTFGPDMSEPLATGLAIGHCPGHFRLDPGPDEPLTDRQGRPYGVTRDELVAEMIRGYVVGGTDELPDLLGLDIASTYHGRAR